MKRLISSIVAVVFLLCARANASVDPRYGYQQTWHFSTLTEAAAYVGLHPGYQVIVDSNGTAPMRYTVWPPSTFTCSSPHCANGLTFQLADDYVINSSFVTSIAWTAITGKPTTLGGYGITDAVAQTLQIIISGGGATVNGGSSTTLAGNVTFALDRGTAHASIPFYDDSRFTNDRVATGLRDTTGVVDCSAATAPSAGQVPTATDATHCTWQTPATVSFGAVSSEVVGGSSVNGVATTAARSDHVHALPAFGTTSGTFAQGNDSRLSDDRVAIGLRDATGVVNGTAATAPITGQVVTAIDATHFQWTTPSGTTPDATASVKGVVQLAGDLCAGSAAAPGVCKMNGASVPAAGALTTGQVPVASGISALTYQFLSNASISTSAAIAESKLAACGSYQFVGDVGSGVTCSPFSDTWHGNRNGGTLHALANASAAGFLTSLGATANAFLSTDGSGNQSFAVLPYVTASLRGVVPPITGPNLPLVSNSAGTGIGWNQVSWSAGIAGIPTPSCTAPITCPASLSSGSWGVNNATTSTTGVVELASDLGGTATSPTVLRVNGTTYPAGGALTSFAVPIVSGSSSVTYNLIGNPSISSGANISVSKLEHGAAGTYFTSDGSTNSFTPLPYPLNAPSTLITGSGTAGVFPVFTGSIGIGNSILSQPSVYGISDAATSNLGNSWTSGGGFRHFTLGSCYFDGTNFTCPGAGTNAIEMITSRTDGIYFSTANSIGTSTRTATSADLDAITRMTIKDDGVRMLGLLSVTGGEISSHNINSYRIVNGNYGEFWRSNADDLYLLITNSGDQSGSFNALRPLTVHAATGNVAIGGTAYPGASALTVGGQVQITGGSPGIGKVLTDSDGAGTALWHDPNANSTNKITNIWYSGSTRNWDSSFWFYVVGPISSLVMDMALCGDWAACASVNTAIIAQSVVTLEVSSISAVTGGVNSCVQTFNGMLDTNGITTWEIAQGFIENTNLRIGSCAFAASPVLSIVGGNNIRVTITDPANQFITMKLHLTGTGGY